MRVRRAVARGIAVVVACGLAVAGGVTAAAAATPAGSPGCGSGATGYHPATPARAGEIVHVPDGYRTDRPVPMILAFHGAGSSPADMERYSDLDRADAIVVYPQGRPYTDNSGKQKTGWAPTNYLPDRDTDVDYAETLAADVGRALCVDPGRVFATGKSQGGGFTYLLACKQKHATVSAVAPVAGAFYRPGSTYHGVDSCDPTPRDVLEIHGDADQTIDYDGRDGDQQGRARAIRTYRNDQGWVDEWVARDGCDPAADSHPTPEPRGAHVHRWQQCRDGSRVEHYRILGGKHVWPGSNGSSGAGDPCVSDVRATRVVLDFFGVATTAEPRTTC